MRVTHAGLALTVSVGAFAGPLHRILELMRSRPGRGWGFGGAVALTLAMGASLAVGAAYKPSTPIRGMIAFVRYAEASGHPRIYTKALGSGRVRLLRLSVPAAEGPAWSPNGRRLAFIGGSNTSGESHVTVSADLYVWDENGPPPRRLTRSAGQEAGPVWSPDGRRLAFVRSGSASSRSSIWIIGADGGRPRRLTYGNIDLQPSWAPDGRTIAFLRIAAKTRQPGIWVVRPNGSGLRRILAGSTNLTEPVWSPDGTRLLVHDGRTLYSVRPDGSGRRSLATLSTNARGALQDPQPAWSPDGRSVVFCQPRSRTVGRSDLWIVAADGTGLRRLTRSPGLDTDPSWGA